ncbi:LAG1 longevity assurance homolog 2-like isoform X2 [Papaver somniferum]|nr:LAG1 longevity assurance homolog 2-like isoform X2 [Papaver somniferum]
MDSIWSRDGVPEVKHFSIAIFFAIFFIAAHFFLDAFLFQKFAKWLLSDGIVPLKMTKSIKRKVAKCSESMWKLTYYGTVQACLLTVIYHEPWSRDINQYFKGWPNQELKLPFTLLYMCQCGFYLYSIAALLTWETRRKDFSIMMSHHIVTVFLIGFSYFTSFFRIGLIVVALHDACDVFMEAAKVFKYSENEFAASVIFGFFAVSWVILRLVFFPFWVIRCSSYNLIEVLKLSEAYHTFLYYFFNTMLLTLLNFHIYWWILIYSMIRRQLKNRGKVGEDIRSDSDDD